MDHIYKRSNIQKVIAIVVLAVLSAGVFAPIAPLAFAGSDDNKDSSRGNDDCDGGDDGDASNEARVENDVSLTILADSDVIGDNNDVDNTASNDIRDSFDTLIEEDSEGGDGGGCDRFFGDSFFD